MKNSSLEKAQRVKDLRLLFCVADVVIKAGLNTPCMLQGHAFDSIEHCASLASRSNPGDGVFTPCQPLRQCHTVVLRRHGRCLQCARCASLSSLPKRRLTRSLLGVLSLKEALQVLLVFALHLSLHRLPKGYCRLKGCSFR